MARAQHKSAADERGRNAAATERESSRESSDSGENRPSGGPREHSSLRVCDKCGTACYPEDSYCPSCGTTLAPICSSCGASSAHPISRFCTQCGAELRLRSRFGGGRTFLLALLGLLLLNSISSDTLSAQGPNPIIVTTNVVPPYDPDLSVWERNPNRLLVTLRNTDATNNFRVRLGGSVVSDDGAVSIELDNNFAATPINLAPGETRVLNARQTGLFDPLAVIVSGTDRDEIARTRKLPEANYRVCLQALDFNTLDPLSAGDPLGCASFFVREADLPRPFFPGCGDVVRPSPIQTVNIQWSRPAVASGGILQYELVIVEVADGKTPEEAILSATTPLFFQKEGIATNYYQYGPIDPALEEGTLYAWRVRAYEVTGSVSFPNAGWSEICSFRYGEAADLTDLSECDAPAVTATFPTIPATTPSAAITQFPYRNVPFLVRYTPFCATMKEFTSDLQVKDSTGRVVDSWTRSFTWDPTPYDEAAEKAESKGGGPPAEDDIMTEDNIEAHTPFYIARPPSDGKRQLPPGIPLRWNAQVQLATAAGASWTRQVAGAVKVGMGKPAPSAPTEDARTPVPVVFRFQTANRPTARSGSGGIAKIVPTDDAVYEAETARGYMIDSIGRVQEIWMLEVSPTPFNGRDTIVYTKTGKLTARIPLTSSVESATEEAVGGGGPATNQILSRIYKSVTDTARAFAPTGGDYYWRVKWLVDNDTNRMTRNAQIIADTAAYSWSEVRHFTVDTTLDSASTGIDSLACLNVRPVLPTNGGDWTEDLRPQFAISIDPAIDSSAITGGKLEVWRLDRADEQQNPKSVLLFPADLSWNVSGPNFLKARPAAPTPPGGRPKPRIYDLDIVNLPTSAKEWIAGRDSNYAWRVTLRFAWNKSRIRKDSVICDADSVRSGLSTFRVWPKYPSIPDSVCIIMAPKTPVHNARIQDSLPVFSVEVTPPIDTAGVDWIELTVWKMRSRTESPATVSRRAPVYTQKLMALGRPGDKFSNSFKPGDLSSTLTIHAINDTADGRRPQYRWHPSIDSTYLWQVSLMRKNGTLLRVDSNDCDGAPDTLRSAFGMFSHDTARQDTLRPCPDSCSSPSPRNRVLREIDFAIGDTVRVGKFPMVLTALDDPSPGGLSGEGEISIPWLARLSVEVEFAGLQVNTRDTVIAGLVRAKQSEAVTLPAEVLNSSGASTWTQEGIAAGYAAATAAGRMANSLLAGGAVSMPIGFESSMVDEAGEQKGGGIAIGITDMTFTPEGANLTALAKMPLPFMGKERGLGFGIRNLCFTPKSFTSGVEKNVFLATDAGFRKDDEWGFKVLAPKTESGVTTDSGTYITWDCHGVSAFRAAVAVEFPRAWMLPIDETGDVVEDSTKLVTATASFLWRRPDPVRADSIKKAKDATVSSSTITRRASGADTTKSKMTKNGFHVLASGTIDRFAPTQTPDLHIEVANITFDWSDFENPSGIVFPSGYTGEMTNLWRGFYLRGAYVRLPNAVTNRDSATKPLAVEAEYLMIDRSGLSVRARADNLLPIDKGRSSGWALGIEKTSLELVNNIPRELSLSGQVRVPIFTADNEAMRHSDTTIALDPTKVRDTGTYRNTTGIGYSATLQYIRQLRPDSGTVAYGSSSSGSTSTRRDTSKYVALPKFVLTLDTRDAVRIPMWTAKASLGGNVTVSIEKRWIEPKESSSGGTPTRRVPKLGWVAGLSLSAALNFGGESTNVSTTASGTTTTTDTATQSVTAPPKMNLAGIGVQGLKFESVSPYVISLGTWTIGGATIATTGSGTGSEASSSSSSSSTAAPATASSAPTTGDSGPQPALEGFPFSVSNITPGTSTNDSGQTTIGLTFDVNLHLLPTATAGFSSTTTLGIFGKQGDSSSGQTFEFSHFELRKIAVDAMFGPAARIKGVVQFYRNDATYGTGFYGAVDATILEKINAKMIAQFGSVRVGPDSSSMRDHRYGLVDFAALFQPGIPLGPTGVSFYGGGGGLWFGMKRTGTGPALPLRSPADPANFRLGQSLSGYIYKPDTATLFGARIMATLGANDPNALNADVGIEIEVTDSWGIGRVSLTGAGYGMMTNFPGGRDSAALTASVDLTYRPLLKEFHGVFAMRLLKYTPLDPNTPAIDVDGSVVMHFDPQDWYVKLGEPSNRINARIGPLASVGAYLMFGNALPPPPAPPGSITSKLGPIAADRDMKVTTGEGVIAGAQARFNTGEKQFTIFYGKVSALVGFDASVLKYSDDLSCGDIKPIGVDYWYANLQMYAELDAQVGIKTKLGPAEIKAEIFNAQAWALLKAGAPNPTWAAGAIAGKYNVLGGLVKGDFTFKFDIGTKCTPGQGVLGNVKLITDISPADKAGDIDPSVSPQAAFAMKVNEPFTTTLADQRGTYRLRIDRFEIQRKSGSRWITQSASSSVDGSKTSASLYPREMLAGETEHRVIVRVRIEKKTPWGSWDLFVVDGNRVIEEKQVVFTSGKLPQTIPASNVAYTWPINRQKYFMKDEGKSRWGNLTGKIVLKQGQAYLFEKDPKATSLKTYVEVSARRRSGAAKRYTATYDRSKREVRFYFPARDLVNAQIYDVKLIREEIYPQTAATIDAKQKQLYGSSARAGNAAYNSTYARVYSQLYSRYFNETYNRILPSVRAEMIRRYGRFGAIRAVFEARSRAGREARSKAGAEARSAAAAARTKAEEDADGSTAETTDRKLEGVSSSGRNDVRQISHFSFRTSKYNTYLAKLRASSVKSTYRYANTTDVWIGNNSEAFDRVEIHGYRYFRDGRYHEIVPRINRASSSDASRSWHRDMIEGQIRTVKGRWEEWYPTLKWGSTCWDSENWACRDWYWNKNHAYITKTSNLTGLYGDNEYYWNYVYETTGNRKFAVVQNQGYHARQDYDMMKRVEGKWWFKLTKTTTETVSKVVTEVVTKTVTYAVKVFYTVTYWVESVWHWFNCKVLGIRSYCGYNKSVQKSKWENRTKQVTSRVNKTVTQTITKTFSIPSPRWIQQYRGQYYLHVGPATTGGAVKYTFTR